VAVGTAAGAHHRGETASGAWHRALRGDARRHRADGNGNADLFRAGGRGNLRPGQSQCRRAGRQPAPIGCGPQQYAFAKRGDRRRPLTAQQGTQGQGMATNKKKILVTESMSQQGRKLLHARDDIELIEFPNMISQADFNAKLKEHAPVHGVALGGTRFGDPELDSSGDMLVVTRIGVGFDAVDVPALSRRNVPLMVAGTANSPSVAECAVFMMLTLAKRAAEMHSLVRDDKWADRLGMLPYDLFGKTVLIIGFGRIGTRTAKRCLAMEMNVLVFDPYKAAADIKASGCEPVDDLNAALPRADFVSVHCPKNPETVGMFDADRLKRMKPTAYLINTARGGI